MPSTVAEVVATASVAVTLAEPVMAGGVETVHVGVSPEAAALTLQLRATLPVNCPLGVMVMVEEPVPPGAAMPMGVPARVKPGFAAVVTSTGMLVTAERPAEVPAMLRV